MRGVMLSIFLLLLPVGNATSAGLSENSDICIGCHASVTPGIVADWERSLHAKKTPAEALKAEALKRRISASKVPDGLLQTVVGCAECHTMNPEIHTDSFEHNGYRVHIIVTPSDCATCHPTERAQYEQNIMSYAYGNLNDNPVYSALVNSVNGLQTFEKMKTSLKAPDEKTNSESCFYCHGTEVKVEGMRSRETALGEMEFPLLAGWPNQGVGRLNPDGSMGACSSCHTRHQFSIEMARKPHTCGECHKGPDVPAYKVYEVSKHGNLYSSLSGSWNFDNVPWVVGNDFTAPTCAGCHVSLIVTDDGQVVTPRSHRMNDRLSWRIFGLIYAHPHPKSPNTTIIKNRAGLPLPTELTGEPVSQYLIDKKEQAERRAEMEKLCRSCHASGWVQGHFARFDNSVKTTNEMTLTATGILMTAWEKKAALGLPQGANIFDEAIEKMWVEEWLFFANSTRFASAMAGADYGAFANGRWYMSKNLQEMLDWLEFKLKD
jgi:hydroxylamine dehydrogenase